MRFLAPIFLLGALGIGLPVLFHLIRRTSKHRTPFSSLMFLTPSPPRLTRRSRLEHLLLLMLRCAVVCFLALAFARPFFTRNMAVLETGPGKRVVVLVDTSASMRRGNLWAQAQKRVLTVVNRISAADQVALYAFDREIRPLLPFERWMATAPGSRAALAEQVLKEASPGWLSTSLGQALMAAADVLAEAKSQAPILPVEIVMVSDFQEGGRLESVQGFEWPKDIRVSTEPVSLPRRSNASMQLVTSVNELGAGTESVVKVRVSNAPDSAREEFKVGWAGGENPATVGTNHLVYVPAGQTRLVTLPASEATPAKADRVVLSGDDEPFDNTVFVAAPEPPRLQVLFLGPDSETNSKQQLYFLKRAFQETNRRVVQVSANLPTAPVPQAELPRTQLFIVGGEVSSGNVASLSKQVIEGKTLLFVLTDESAGKALGTLLGVEELSTPEATGLNHAILGSIDFQHPLFVPFADPRYSDFSRIHFWRHRVVDSAQLPNSRVLAKFDSGAPALLQVPLGKGQVFVLTSGWNPADSQLALSTKFVPLLYSLLELTGAPEPPPLQYFVGDPVPVAEGGPTGAPGAVSFPDGAKVELAPDQAKFAESLAPGVYTLHQGERTNRFAVNLDPAESRLAPLGADALELLGVPMAKSLAAAAREAASRTRLQNAELENRQKLWRWVILATLAVMLVESTLALRTARRTALGNVSPAPATYGT